MILGSHTVKNALVNFSRSTVITAGPAFHQVAAIRAGYSLLPQPETEEVGLFSFLFFLSFERLLIRN